MNENCNYSYHSCWYHHSSYCMLCFVNQQITKIKLLIKNILYIDNGLCYRFSITTPPGLQTFFKSLVGTSRRFWVKSSTVKSSQVQSSTVKSRQVQSSPVKSSQVQSSPVKSCQVPYWGAKNTRRHHKLFSRHGDLVPGICVFLTASSSSSSNSSSSSSK
jgi:hypothetical protein